MVSESVPSTAEEVIKQYGPEVKGIMSACGIVIGEISDHAARRIAGRGITFSELYNLITKASITYPGNISGRTCQQKDNLRLVLINDTGEIRSVIRL